MSYGAIIRNGSNEIILDSDHDSFARVSDTTMSDSYDFTFNFFGSSDTAYVFDMPTQSASFPSFVFVPFSTGDIVGIDPRQGGIIRYENNNNAIVCNPSSSINLPTSGFGMRIYKEDGSVSYDSTLELGRVIDAASPDIDQTVTIDSSVTHVAIQEGAYSIIRYSNFDAILRFVMLERISATSVKAVFGAYSIGLFPATVTFAENVRTNFLLGRFI
jgi:hypothetical protein